MYREIQLILQIYFIACHNILRLPTVRKARFELRHTDKVQSKSHFKELQLKTIEVCVDRCVADSQCKSVNFIEYPDPKLDVCQLVAYDITDNNNYTDRVGWQHFDTGRTKLTRIHVKSTGYCYVPQDTDCEFTWSYLIALPGTNSRCNDLTAYFEFDRDNGHIYHYCTGKLVGPHPYGNAQYVKVMDTKIDGYDTRGTVFGHISTRWRRWQVHYDGTLYFDQYCIRPRDPTSSLSYVYAYSTCFDGNNQYMHAIFPDLEQNPVKASWYHGHSYSSYSGVLSSMQSVISSRSPNVISYATGFQYTKRTPLEQFTLRMQAIFRAPCTGTHKFWLIGDDYAFLFIGNDETEASKHQVATLTGYTTGFTEGHSGTKYMEKGKRYYMEILHHEKYGNDWVTLAMTNDLYYEKMVVSHGFLEPYNG